MLDLSDSVPRLLCAEACCRSDSLTWQSKGSSPSVNRSSRALQPYALQHTSASDLVSGLGPNRPPGASAQLAEHHGPCSAVGCSRQAASWCTHPTTRNKKSANSSMSLPTMDTSSMIWDKRGATQGEIADNRQGRPCFCARMGTKPSKIKAVRQSKTEEGRRGSGQA